MRMARDRKNIASGICRVLGETSAVVTWLAPVWEELFIVILTVPREDRLAVYRLDKVKHATARVRSQLIAQVYDRPSAVVPMCDFSESSPCSAGLTRVVGAQLADQSVPVERVSTAWSADIVLFRAMVCRDSAVRPATRLVVL